MKKTLCVFLGVVAVAGAGCGGDDGPTTVAVAPQARVRFFNASPDSPASLEAVFVDRVENAYTFRRVGFRGHSGEYRAVNAGERRLRAFRPLSAGTVDTAQVIVLDTTFTLDADQRYTILQYGSTLAAAGSAGAARVAVFRDTLPESVAAGTIAVRVYNVLAAAPAADVAIAPRSRAAGVGAPAATIANVAYLGRSPYAAVPALGAADTSAFYNFTVTAAGSATPLASNFPTTMGSVAGATPLSAAGAAFVAAGSAPAQTPLAGVRQAGSVLSAFVTPAVAGSATARPVVVLVPDRPPPVPAP